MNFRLLKIFSILILLFNFSSVGAQQNSKAKILARPYKDSIALRWQIYDPALWKANIKKGYDVYRKDAKGTIIKLNDSAVKALTPQQLPWRYLKLNVDTTNMTDEKWEQLKPEQKEIILRLDSSALKAMLLQFPDEHNINFDLPEKGSNVYFGADKDSVRWLFHSLTCLSSREAAIVSGWFYLDKKVKSSEQYTYYLTTSGEGIEKALASVIVSPSDPYLIRKPTRMSDFTNRKRAVMMWKKADTLTVWLPTYNIYRSETKNGNYIQLNKNAVLAVYERAIDSTIVSYNDSTLEKGKTYYYKVRGLDVFGEFTPYSDPYMVTEKVLMQYAPYIEETRKEGKPDAGFVKWNIEPTEEENIAYFNVFKSRVPDTLYVSISENLKKETRTFIDKTPTKNNYYKILSVGNAGDSLWSTPGYLMVPDSIPPASPVMVKALCDSSGVVTISWKHNSEIDLASFKLYRANYSHEEFSRVATIERVDTIYRDTISLASLTEQVYYKLIAYDDSYNPSPFSNVIKAKRYDTIAPTHPVFTGFRSDSAGIKLTWGNSSSSDVVKTILYRKLRDELSWHEYKTFAADTNKYTTFVDKPEDIYKGQWYQYTLQAFDDDKNASGFSQETQVRAYDNGLRGEIKNITYKTDIRKRTVKLSWDYPYSGVRLFQIYRGTNDKPMTILKSIEPGVREYYDQEVGSGNKYTYRVKAVYKDGGESPFTKEIVVQF